MVLAKWIAVRCAAMCAIVLLGACTSDGEQKNTAEVGTSNVVAVNGSPTIAGEPITAAQVGGNYFFQPSASDPEGAVLTFSIENQPAWVNFDTTTGALRGSPTAAGVFGNIVISVSDGNTSASLQAFSIEVTSADGAAVVNTAPTISGEPGTTATVGTPYNFQPAAGDANGDSLVFSIQNLPSWASFNTSSGALTGTPTAAGTFSNIVISASDGQATASLAAFSISVAATNSAPTIGGTPSTAATVGVAYSFTPTAQDANGDTLAFSITNRPSWAAFDTLTGALTGTPTTAGTFADIVINVSDGNGSASLASFTINVAAAAAQVVTDSVTLSWTAPTQNTDGTELTDLSGYRIYYGTSADNLSNGVDVAATATEYTISGLTVGTTYYFALTALNLAGIESERSTVVSRTI